MDHQGGETRLAIATQRGMPLTSSLHWGALGGAGSLYQVSSMARGSPCPVLLPPLSIHRCPPNIYPALLALTRHLLPGGLHVEGQYDEN